MQILKNLGLATPTPVRGGQRGGRAIGYALSSQLSYGALATNSLQFQNEATGTNYDGVRIGDLHAVKAPELPMAQAE